MMKPELRLVSGDNVRGFYKGKKPLFFDDGFDDVSFVLEVVAKEFPDGFVFRDFGYNQKKLEEDFLDG